MQRFSGMPFDVALFDLIAPYLLLGKNLGPIHAALSVLAVDSYQEGIAEGGVVVRGIAHFHGDAGGFFDPANGTFGANAANTEGHPKDDPGRRDPWFDIRDTHVDFNLVARRHASQIVATGAAGLPAATAGVLSALDPPPGPDPSDYPNTEFTLDLVLSSVVLRPPFLVGAKLRPDGLLEPDADHKSVTFTLPKVKLRLAQGSTVGSRLTLDLVSLGASGLDDPGDLGVVDFVTMDPPYAFVGDSRVVGFGFRSAVLDLSDGATPPDVLSQFGFDESWQGLYLPEIRLFIAPHGMQDIAVDAGARNLLIGFGASAGITGDFELDVIQQGAGPLHLGARFYDATGRAFGITPAGDGHATASLPEHTRMVVDINGGRTPYTCSVSIDGGGAQTGRVFEIDLSAAATRTVAITAGGGGAGQSGSLSIALSRRPPPTLTTGGGAGATAPSVPAATVTTTSGVPPLRRVSSTDSDITISLDPANPQTAWSVDGAASGPPSATRTIPVGPSESHAVTATVAGSTGVQHADCYFHFDHPLLGDDAGVPPFGYSTLDDNTHTQPAIDEPPASGWTGGTSFQSGNADLFSTQVPSGSNIAIDGYASFEGDDSPGKQVYNLALSRRRALGLQAIIETRLAGGRGFTFTINAHGHGPAQAAPSTPRPEWWRATATAPGTTVATTVTTGTLSRPALPTPGPPPPPPAVVPDPPPATPPPPDWFHSIGVKVRIVRNAFVACELHGEVDFETAVEGRLRNRGLSNPSDLPSYQALGQNPADGIVQFRVVVSIDDATGEVDIVATVGADPADKDGLYMTGALPGQPRAPRNTGRNVLGVIALFTPILAETAPANPLDGDLAEIALTGAVVALPLTLAALDMLTVERVVWYGGELAVRVRSGGPEATLLLDVETAVSLDLNVAGVHLLEIPPEHPLVVRYKAIGLRVGTHPGDPRFQLRPMFDASKGYTIDLSSPGSVRVPDPLGQIFQVLGARMARTNPLTFEVDLGLSVDLGVVSVDRLRVRMALDPLGPPELTAIGAGVDIPGALKGHGYLELNGSEIKGQIDLTLVPVNVRVAAGLGIANIGADQGGPATGVIVSLEVDLPVAIPLANSGLGIYGFVGLFAMHYARDESHLPSTATPALAWLVATGGDPTNLNFWKPTIGHWAFGVGALLGTMEGGVILNLKGVLLLELPGPRVLLMMKARIISPPPTPLKSPSEGNLLAVIDLDAARGTLTVGLVAQYDVSPLFKVRIPAEAFFNFNDLSDWHFNLGSFQDPIQASVLLVFDGSGYLMLAGNGIPAHNNLPAVHGFSIALGLHVAIVWGSVAVGLFVRVTAAFDAVVGFSPFRMAGKLHLGGELHLFIVSIGASADLSVDVGRKDDGTDVAVIDGDVCGEVDFFFFSISACVHFHLGDPSIPPPDPPELITGVTLVSRSPALVTGTGVDRPIDSALAHAVRSDAGAPSLDAMTPVPIDAVPVVMCVAPPLDTGLTVLGAAPGGSPHAPADGWVGRSDVLYKYELTSVELVGALGAGATPATWWTVQPPASGDAPNAQLALLSWVPDPTPKAVERSDALDETVRQRWGTVCSPTAPAAAVLWTFEQQLLGPSPTGWQLIGTMWPDPPGSQRSSEPRLGLLVDERWRSGDPVVDLARGIVPAVVVGAAVPCPDHHPPGQAPIATAGGFGSVAASALSPAAGRFVLDAVPAVQFSLTEVLDRASLGVTLSRGDVIGSLGVIGVGPPAGAAAGPAAGAPAGAAASGVGGPGGQRSCEGRALAAPAFDDGEIVRFGDLGKRGEIAQRWSQLGFKPGDLNDCVVIHTGGFGYLRLLMYIPRASFEAGLVVRSVAGSGGAGAVVDQRSVGVGDMVTAAQLPPRWVDASGPWFADVDLVIRALPNLMPIAGVMVLVTVKGAGQADRVEVGLTRPRDKVNSSDQLGQRPYFVAVIESLLSGEVARSDYDSTTATRTHSVLEKALGPDSTSHALLAPDTTYQVKTGWKVSRAKRDASGTVVADTTLQGKDATASFWFHTDHAAPQRLDPWLLTTTPAEAEQHVFCADPLQIVFSTDDVASLYDAYGLRLQVRLKAASLRHPDPAGGVPHPFPIDGTTLQKVPAAVLSPWEQTVGSVVDASCVAVDGNRTRHTQVTIPIPLDPLTDYVLDIEAVAKAAPAGATGGRVLRRSFSTSRYTGVGDFAAAFTGTRLNHRGTRPGVLQAVGATLAGQPPQGHELDAALIAAGLEPLPVPSSPKVTLFWEQADPTDVPAPAAVLIDAPEPLWRRRPLPTDVSDPPPSTARRFELHAQEWLGLIEDAASGGLVDHIVPAPGGQRALVTLKPGSRGRRLVLSLQTTSYPKPVFEPAGAIHASTILVDVAMVHAPWEEL